MRIQRRKENVYICNTYVSLSDIYIYVYTQVCVDTPLGVYGDIQGCLGIVENQMDKNPTILRVGFRAFGFHVQCYILSVSL